MQFEVRNKKFVELLLSLSFKSAATSVVSSFVLASMISVGIAIWFMPTDSKTSSRSSGRARIELPPKGLSKDDLKVILDRNIFNSEGTLGDADPTLKKPGVSVPAGQLVNPTCL